MQYDTGPWTFLVSDLKINQKNWKRWSVDLLRASLLINRHWHALVTLSWESAESIQEPIYLKRRGRQFYRAKYFLRERNKRDRAPINSTATSNTKVTWRFIPQDSRFSLPYEREEKLLINTNRRKVERELQRSYPAQSGCQPSIDDGRHSRLVSAGCDPLKDSTSNQNETFHQKHTQRPTHSRSEEQKAPSPITAES